MPSASGDVSEDIRALVEATRTMFDRPEVRAALPALIADIFADPHFKARESMTTVEVPGVGDITVPAVFPKLSLTPGEVATLGPALGEANDTIYGEELGLTAEQRRKLNQDGVI